MNYLAHIYLAGEDEELIVGNFIADSVKGSQHKNYSKGIEHGILMHRAIDYFSDTHPVYLKSAHRLAPKHGKFSGVITDMLYDYLLASNWKDFSDVALADFAEKSYSVLHKHSKHMPEKSRIILQYMSKHNWLLTYQSHEGIKRALYGLSSRMKYYHPMHEAMDQVQTDIVTYTAEFRDFFPLLQEHVIGLKKY